MKLAKGWWFPDADRFMADQLADDGTYQGDHLAAALKYVTDFRTAIDGGAHIGTWSKTMATRFENVLAFEPSTDTAEALQANMEQFGCNNVRILRQALSDCPELVRLTLDGRPEDQERGNTGARRIMKGGKIEAITLDSLKLENLGFLKLDIEGAEYKAFVGARATLKRCRPVILFEDKRKCQKLFNVDRAALHNLLKSYGFRHAERAGCDEIWVPA